MPVSVKRVYDPAAASDGVRVLVDRLWPRGISKKTGRIDLWLRDVAPSNELRRWYDHDPAKWGEFRRRYKAELGLVPDVVRRLAALVRRRRVTLLFASRERARNNATALRALLARSGRKARR